MRTSNPEGADPLNVSRPHLINQFESQPLRYHKTGEHRRIRYDDLMRFKADRDMASEHAMEELARQAEELNLGMTEGYVRCVSSSTRLRFATTRDGRRRSGATPTQQIEN